MNVSGDGYRAANPGGEPRFQKHKSRQTGSPRPLEIPQNILMFDGKGKVSSLFFLLYPLLQ